MTDLDCWLAEVAGAVPEGATVELHNVKYGEATQLLVMHYGGGLRVQTWLPAEVSAEQWRELAREYREIVEMEATGRGEFQAKS